MRVLTPGAYEIHRKEKDGEFKLFDEAQPPSKKSRSLSLTPTALACWSRGHR